MVARGKQPYKDFVIIKLGGSVVTRREGELDTENVRSLAEEIVESRKMIVIVHGGGSVAKRVLLKQKVQSDFLSSEQQVVIEQFRESFKSLNEDILRIFKDADLKCISISPHSILTSDAGEIIECDITEIRQLLADGINPALHSDILVDKTRTYYTCSSDKIASHLAKIMRPQAVLFLTDVDGVYECYPLASDRVKPLPVADITFLNRMHNDYKVGSGDMYGKLAQAIACAPYTEFCCILNGRVRGNLISALRGRIRVGTKVI